MCVPLKPIEPGSQDPEQAAKVMRAAVLRQRHDDYKLAIDAMIAQGVEALAVQRMKKRKLEIKDELTRLESSIRPDIIA